MYIVVAGAGTVGYHLSKELIAQGHEVVLIEQGLSAHPTVHVPNGTDASGGALPSNHA